MSLDERLELVEYVERSVQSAPLEVTEEQKAMTGHGRPNFSRPHPTV